MTYYIIKNCDIARGIGTLAQTVEAESADEALTIWATTGKLAIGSLSAAKSKGFVAVDYGRTRDGSFAPVWEA